MNGALAIGGVFYVERWREGKRISVAQAKNGFTSEGLRFVLDLVGNQESPAALFVGLIDDEGFDEVSAADTMASHTGWTEITAYDEATRQAWSPDVAAGTAISNPIRFLFTMNDEKDIGGMFLTTSNTKGGTTGTLICTGIFDVEMPMLAGEEFKGFYRLVAEGR